MHRKPISMLLLVIAILCSVSLSAQENFTLTNWKIHSAFSNIREFAINKDGAIVCATNGGILYYFEKLNKIDYFDHQSGLASTDIRTIHYDKSKDIIVSGSYDGVLQIITGNKKIEIYNDIKSYGFQNPEITDIKQAGDFLYISGSFGIAVFDLNKKIFTETITKIADYARNTKINNLYIVGETIYAASESGVAYANRKSLLANPGNWQSIPAYIDTLKNNLLSKYRAINIVEFKNDLYAIVNDSIITKVNINTKDTFNLHARFESYRFFKNFYEVNDKLYFSDLFNLLNKESELFANIPAYYYKLEALQAVEILETTPKIKALLSFRDNGFGIYQNDSLRMVDIESPITSKYYQSAMDKDANLWLASASLEASIGRGLSVWTNSGKWINITQNSDTAIKANNFFNISVLPDGRVFSGNWGGGLFEISINKNKSIKKYDSFNSPLTSYKGNDNWVIAGETKMDKNGVVWTLNTLASNGKKLFIKHKGDGTFESIDYPAPFTSRDMVFMEIDNANTKWFACAKPEGLYYFNESKNIYGNVVNAGTNLASNSINCLKIDSKGYLWVASEAGLNVIINPTAVLNNGKLTIRKISYLNNIFIKNIYIDAIDNKWLSTNQGVIVVSPDGSKQLAKFDTKNSPLKTNIVNSVSSNTKTGQVFITTDNGIYTATSLSVKPEETYNISCYPQPFDPDGDNMLIIEGLAKDNTLKIVTPEGRYVATVEAAGARAIWDGRDSNGKIVENGIYIIIANEAGGGEASAGKIAVEKRP